MASPVFQRCPQFGQAIWIRLSERPAAVIALNAGTSRLNGQDQEVSAPVIHDVRDTGLYQPACGHPVDLQVTNRPGCPDDAETSVRPQRGQLDLLHFG